MNHFLTLYLKSDTRSAHLTLLGVMMANYVNTLTHSLKSSHTYCFKFLSKTKT